MGAPLGNQNAIKAKRFQQAIDRALAKKSKAEGVQALDAIAEKIVTAAMAGPSYAKGDPWLATVTQLADRLDGRPAQMIVGPGDEGQHSLDVKWAAEK